MRFTLFSCSLATATQKSSTSSSSTAAILHSVPKSLNDALKLYQADVKRCRQSYAKAITAPTTGKLLTDKTIAAEKRAQNKQKRNAEWNSTLQAMKQKSSKQFHQEKERALITKMNRGISPDAPVIHEKCKTIEGALQLGPPPQTNTNSKVLIHEAIKVEYVKKLCKASIDEKWLYFPSSTTCSSLFSSSSAKSNGNSNEGILQEWNASQFSFKLREDGPGALPTNLIKALNDKIHNAIVIVSESQHSTTLATSQDVFNEQKKVMDDIKDSIATVANKLKRAKKTLKLKHTEKIKIKRKLFRMKLLNSAFDISKTRGHLRERLIKLGRGRKTSA